MLSVLQGSEFRPKRLTKRPWTHRLRQFGGQEWTRGRIELAGRIEESTLAGRIPSTATNLQHPDLEPSPSSVTT